jgi:hypothetical protein
MKNYKKIMSYLVISSVFTIMILGVSCGPKQRVVIISSPYERYDHNRTKKIIIEFSGTAEEKSFEIKDEDYIPRGSKKFPAAHYTGKISTVDELPVANLVPIFTGVILPLSDDSSVGSARSDREDLIDFMAEGPLAQVGVEPGDMAGDIETTRKLFKPLLDLLDSEEELEGDREQMINRLSSKLDIVIADEIIDSRYRLRAFSDVLGLCYEKFWFVLYKTRRTDYYSRLVVVPAKFKGQKIREKGIK